MTDLAELTLEEQSRPYSKYYYIPPAAPDPGMLEQVLRDKPLDPDAALRLENISDLLSPGYLDSETGWCVFSNGAGYVSVHNRMPGVTVEMVNWWFAWHGLESLRYKLWWPKGHFAVSVSEKDRQKILDPNRPLVDKFQGITHHVVEDTGAGPEDIFISFLRPEEMGFDMERFKRPNVGTFVGGYGFSSPVGAPPEHPKQVATMCHFVREIEGGVEFRTRFWFGYHIIDGEPTLMLPPGVRVPEIFPYALTRHNIEEYCRLKAILPQIYQEQRGVVE